MILHESPPYISSKVVVFPTWTCQGDTLKEGANINKSLLRPQPTCQPRMLSTFGHHMHQTYPFFDTLRMLQWDTAWPCGSRNLKQKQVKQSESKTGPGNLAEPAFDQCNQTCACDSDPLDIHLQQLYSDRAADIPKKWKTRSMKTRSDEPSIHGHHRKLMEIQWIFSSFWNL